MVASVSADSFELHSLRSASPWADRIQNIVVSPVRGETRFALKEKPKPPPDAHGGR